MNRIILFLIVSIPFLVSINAEDDPIISTSLGLIRGSLMTTNFGKTIYAFRGIPYAQAPIGDLRFKAPVPIKSYNGTFDASNEGPACYQEDTDLELSEDCLRLNVYTTNIPKTSQNEKRPVIFFIHSGGFYSVSGQSKIYGPQYILDQDIVLVPINYRLGSLGFLSTGDKHAPGNNGMKDQVAALQWVKQNIDKFGGDPDNITIMGYSAGSMSAILHLISPMTRGLFHKVIAMSGAIGGNFKIVNNQKNLADKQAILVGCPTNSTELMMSCLRSIPAGKIAESFDDFFEFRFDPILIWTPVIEEDFGQERFLTDNPEKLLQNGDFSNIPIMMGITEFEFAGPAYQVAMDDKYRNEMNQNWDTLAPIAFLYERNTSRSKTISKRLKDYYLKSEDIQNSDASIEGLVNLYADGVIGFAVHRCADLLVNSNTNHLYYYRFSYKGQFSHFYLPNSNSTERTTLGAVHHDELIYLFYISVAFPKFPVTDPDYVTVNKLTKMWTDFAKSGNPTPQISSLLNNVIWPPYTREKLYVDINRELQVKNCLYCDRYRVWDELFPLDPQKL